MNHVPRFWSAAYGPDRSPITRFLARRALAVRAFVYDLATADHQPFASL
ncbi:hypothetical protein J4573_23325 [Actinomadura barringtoniae]|uniref:Uncharacterized protein n=1 Tax=Actinomadura barringtoniae TaxID=1427535 RepID=A0A939T5X1_9ACTN|nr:hypothetical protein [Actinomadura barringtoniae]MBO2450054.1 hypothetical protein [Actinomadura barringtoniae]